MTREQNFKKFDEAFEKAQKEFFAKDYIEVKEEDRQQYLENLYKEVVKDFSEMDKEEIKIEPIEDDSLDIGIQMIDYLTYILEGEQKINPIIYVGIPFFNLDKDEQKGGIAHELGHYLENKDKCFVKLIYEGKIRDKLREYHRNELYLNKRKFDRFLEVCLRNEISADNWAIKKGYGKNLLKYFKAHNQRSGITKFRIKNLEYHLSRNTEEYTHKT